MQTIASEIARFHTAPAQGRRFIPVEAPPRIQRYLVALAVAAPVGGVGWPGSAAAQITEFTLPASNSQPYGITAGPDGALWFAERNGNKIGRITTDGVITEFAIPTSNSGAVNITAGPDGALWFTESGGNKIGRSTTAGGIGEFTIPTGDSLPTGIAAGPDGALWFTEHDTNKIGRITTAGGISEFTVPCTLQIARRINTFAEQQGKR
jgi:virginiamycin B lyase